MEKSSVTGIIVTDDVALMTIESKRYDPYFVYKILDLITPLNIKSGMVMASLSFEKKSRISFAVDETKVIESIKALEKMKDDVFLTVNGMNTKITIVGRGLSDTDFVVKNILDPLYECDLDIKLITASQNEICAILSQSKTDVFLKCLNHLIK